MTSPTPQEHLPYPFRFYGHRPRDWRPGACPYHFYRLQFATPPAPEHRAQLAIASAETPLHAGREPWLWTGRWLGLLLGENVDSEFFFDDVEDLLRRLHDTQPLTEVVHLDAGELSDSEWEQWSLAQRAQPDPGPPFARESPFFTVERITGDDEAAPAPDPLFEEQRRALAGESADAARPAAVATASPGAVPQGAEQPGAAPVGRVDWDGRITLRRFAPGELPALPALPAEIVAALTPGDFALAAENDVAVIIRSRDGAYDAGEVLANGETRSLVLPEGFGPIESAVLSPVGDHALICDRHRILSLDLPDGEPTLAWEADPELLLCSVAFAADGRIVTSTFAGLLLLAREGGDERFAPVSSYPCAPGTVLPFGDGRLLLVETNDPGLSIFGLVRGELESLATVEDEVRLVFVTGGCVVGRDRDGSFEVTTVAEAYASLS